jgi:hypothetical protein
LQPTEQANASASDLTLEIPAVDVPVGADPAASRR